VTTAIGLGAHRWTLTDERASSRTGSTMVTDAFGFPDKEEVDVDVYPQLISFTSPGLPMAEVTTAGRIDFAGSVVDPSNSQDVRESVDQATRNDIAAAAAAHHELGRDYDDAVAEGLIDRIGTEIDKRVDARLGAGSRGPRPLTGG
jgi:hypothetical protein